MNIKQNSFAVPVMLQLAIDGRQEYLKIKEIPLNYHHHHHHHHPVTKSFIVLHFWLICRNTNNGKSFDVLYDKAKSTDSEIYFLLPSEMFVAVPVQYRCALKLHINESIDFSMENFTITVKPKKEK